MTFTTKSVENEKPGNVRREIPDGKCAGLYLVVQPSGAKSWAYRYRYGGKPKKLTLGAVYSASGSADEPPEAVLGQPATLAVARSLAAEAARKVARGIDPAAEFKDRKAIARSAPAEASLVERDRVEAIAAAFLTKHVATLRPRTREQYEHIMKNMVVKTWRGRTIQAIGKRDVNDLLDDIKEGRGPTAAIRARAVLSKFYKWAMARDIVSASPIAAVERPAKETARERYLDDAELRSVWVAADAIGWPFGHLTKLLILTGARLREVAGMRWSEIDQTAKTWTLPAERSKNRRAHAMPLSDQAIAILQSIPRIGAGPDGFVFTTTGETPISGFARGKARIDARARLAHWQFHDLRRSFAAGLGRLGFSGEVIERSLNHASGAFGGIRGTYQRHHYQEEMRVAFTAWARHIEGLASGAPVVVLPLRTRVQP